MVVANVALAGVHQCKVKVQLEREGRLLNCRE